MSVRHRLPNTLKGGPIEQYYSADPQRNFPRPHLSGHHGPVVALPVHPFRSIPFHASGYGIVDYPVAVPDFVHHAAPVSVSGGHVALEGH